MANSTTQAAEQVTTHFMNQHLMPQVLAQVTDSAQAAAEVQAAGEKTAVKNLTEARAPAEQAAAEQAHSIMPAADTPNQELQTAAAVVAVAAAHTTPMEQAAAQA